MNYILAGMKHCGKSSLGKLLAEKLKVPFYDTDDLIMAKYNAEKDRHLTVRQIFIEEGPGFFKEQEVKVLNELNEDILPKSEDNVVALGGRMPVNIDLILLLHKIGQVIYLKDDPEVLYIRAEKNGPVPFLDEKKPKESFLELYKEREPYYILHADITVDIKNCSIEMAWGKLQDAIENKRGNHGR